MAITAAPFAFKNLGLDAEPLRQAVGSLIPNSGGLVQSGDYLVTQTATPSLGVLVGVGRAWMPGNNLGNLSGQNYTSQGQYFALNDAPFTLNLATADPTNPRIDLIYVGAVDTFYGGSSNQIKIDKITGTPSPSPAVPSLPAGSNAIGLAQVTVAANASSVTNANITYLNPSPLQMGRPIVVANKAARDALTPFQGMEVVRQDRDNWVQTYNGSSWQYLQRPTRYMCQSGDYVNFTGTGSRLVASIPAVPSKSYAQRLSLVGRLTVMCPTISSGVEELNLAVSVAQASVSTAQAKTRMVWTSNLSNVNQTGVVTLTDCLLVASGSPMVRMWLEVVTGTLSTTASGGTFAEFYCDVRPEDD